MMISKTTFVSMITTICTAIDESRWMYENCKRLTQKDKKELMAGCDYQNDLITMLTAITLDRFGVIRDYLYERDENDEYFFGIPKGNKIEVYLLASAEELYDYLALQIVDGMLREVFRGYHKTKNSALKRACPDAASSFH